MKTILLAIATAIVATTALAGAQEKKIMNQTADQARMTAVKRMTANLYTDDVEACVQFWVERLHFEKTMEVKAGDRLAFAALQKGPIELMYGSYASLQADPNVARAYKRGTSSLFVEVEDVNEVFAALKGTQVVSPMHTTSYGSTEFTVTDPAGHLLTFAQFGNQ